MPLAEPAAPRDPAALPRDTLSRDAMDYREFLPPPALRRHVRCLWTLTSPAPGAGEVALEPILPDGCIELVLHWGERFERRPPGGPAVLQSRAFVVGQTSAPFVVAPRGRQGVVAARFRLGGAVPWLRGLPARELCDAELDLAALWPDDADGLLERVALAPDAAVRVAELARWLAARMQPLRSHPAVLHAGGRLEAGEAADVDSLARGAGLGVRQLQRLFAEQVGFGPRLAGRVLRFRRALVAAATAPDAPGVALAVRAGYADQAHLIRDFREFAGTTPREWLRRHTPLAAALAGFPAGSLGQERRSG